MTIGEFLPRATSQLQAAGIGTARLDILVLLEDALAISRASVLAHPERILSQEILHTLEQQLALREQHRPLAYIRGKVLFYGREFIVNEQVLIPRPETEDIVTELKGLALSGQSRIADIGTGSGCLGITAALELPNAAVDLYDISNEALAVAAQNAQRLGARVQCLASDLLSSLRADYDVIITNLPYVPEHYPINKAAGFEPSLALFAGADGMNAYKQFWQQLQNLGHKPSFVLAESLPEQHHANAILARNSGYFLEKTTGFIQLFAH